MSDQQIELEGKAADVAAGIVIALQQAGLIAQGKESITLDIVFKEAMRLLASQDGRHHRVKGLRP